MYGTYVKTTVWCKFMANSLTEYSEVVEQFHKSSGEDILDNYVIHEEGLGK